jgi:hypothetical protein
MARPFFYPQYLRPAIPVFFQQNGAG